MTYNAVTIELTASISIRPPPGPLLSKGGGVETCMYKPTIAAIAAIGKNRELGSSGKIPWYIPEELKHFKNVTMGHPIIMGRKTHESIGRALPGRANIVITRNPEFKADGCIVVTSVEDAISEANQLKAGQPLAGRHGNEEIFIIGGGEIYKLAWDYIDKLYLTVINKDFEADVFFPDYSKFDKVISRKDVDTDEYQLSYIELEKR